jgi:hypothetical protein
MHWKSYIWLCLVDAIVSLAAAALLAKGAWRITVLVMISLFVANMIVVYEIAKRQHPVSSAYNYVKWIAGLGIVFIISGMVALIKGFLHGLSWDTVGGSITVFLLGAMYLRLAWRAHRRAER